MGYCSCGNWVDEGSICSHCGSGGGSSEEFKEPFEKIIEFEEELRLNDGVYDEDDPIAYTPDGLKIIKRYEDEKKAKSYSSKGDHSNAIKYYKQAVKEAWRDYEKCDIMSAIAGEYEKMGDYASALEWWVRCCQAAGNRRIYQAYEYIVGKADFLNRQGRYNEAITSYEEALNMLRSLDDESITGFELKCYAKITHGLDDSYKKLGKDNLEEKYRNELKYGIERYVRSKKSDDETKSLNMSQIAWRIYEDDGLAEEALILIDEAIELHPDCPASCYNRKAIFLNYTHQYEEALKYYDKALSKDRSNETFLKNRKNCEAESIKSKLEIEVLFRRVKPHHLEIINNALKILPKDQDNSRYLNIKADILDQLGESVKAWICRSLAAKDYDTVDKVEKQLKKMKSGGIYINITGIHYYQGFDPFKEGTIVELVREPDNQYDKDAIRVEINGETVGYVANGRNTAIKEVKSATEIKNTGSKHAKVQFILFREWVIAKLI